jgi:prophage antirepressor-like protein
LFLQVKILYDHSHETAKLSKKYKSISKYDTPGGIQNVSIVNEAGLYNIVMRSNKPLAPVKTRISFWLCQ